MRFAATTVPVALMPTFLIRMRTVVVIVLLTSLFDYLPWRDLHIDRKWNVFRERTQRLFHLKGSIPTWESKAST
jgi:hypothetical protein